MVEVLEAGDYVSIAVYFVLVLSVGLWVSVELFYTSLIICFIYLFKMHFHHIHNF